MFRRISTIHIIHHSKENICNRFGNRISAHNGLVSFYHNMKRVSNTTSDFNVVSTMRMSDQERKLKFADILTWKQDQKDKMNKKNAEKEPPIPNEEYKKIVNVMVIPEMRFPKDPKTLKTPPTNTRPFKIETYIGNCKRTDLSIQMSPPRKNARNLASPPRFGKDLDLDLEKERLLNWLRNESEDQRIKPYLRKEKKEEMAVEEEESARSA